MSEHMNYKEEANGEIKGNDINYEGGDYRDPMFDRGPMFDDGNNEMASGMYNDQRPMRNYPSGSRASRANRVDNRMLRANQQCYGPGQNSQYNMPTSPNYNNPRYQGNYNPTLRNYYRGDDGMNYQGNYRFEEDYNYQCPHPYYDGCDYDDYYYDARRPYYKGYRECRRPGNPNMLGYPPYNNQGMMQSSWWHPNMITDFINRPKVNNFLRGVGIATVGLILAPAIARTVRPVVVKAVQGAMVASDELKDIFADAKEDVEDIFAEAKWEEANK